MIETVVERTVTDLEAIYDAAVRFYGKAQVVTKGSHLELLSYGRPVASVDKISDELRLSRDWAASATTLRHVKEFMKQNGFKAETKQQIARDYKEHMIDDWCNQ